MDQKIIEAKFQAALQQRDAANNQIINLVGEITRLQLELEAAKKPKEDVVPSE